MDSSERRPGEQGAGHIGGGGGWSKKDMDGSCAKLTSEFLFEPISASSVSSAIPLLDVIISFSISMQLMSVCNFRTRIGSKMVRQRCKRNSMRWSMSTAVGYVLWYKRIGS
jgi:hypothetical protein